MEEQVIQETPVAPSEQPVAATETPAVDVSAYEQQIQALQQRAAEAEEKFQGIVKHWRIKASGRISGKRPTKLLRPKTSKSLN
jgi:hypothetical protein